MGKGRDGMRRLALEMTFNEVPSIDELVRFVESRAMRLEDHVSGVGRCFVSVSPMVLWDGAQEYEVRVRVVAEDGVAEIRHRDRDPFLGIRHAFDVVCGRLRRPSGTRFRPVAVPPDEPPAAETFSL